MWETFIFRQSRKRQYKYCKSIIKAIVKIVIKTNVTLNHTSNTNRLLVLCHFMKLEIIWLELNYEGLVWFRILASSPLLFFYKAHDMPWLHIQNGRTYILTFSCVSNDVNPVLFTCAWFSHHKQYKRTFFSPSNNTAEL